MTQRHTDSVLFSLDGEDVGRTRAQFKAGVKFAEAGHKAMAYFNDDGEGRLTEGAAKHLAGFIKACIIDNSLLEGREQAWATLSDEYYKRKKGRYRGKPDTFWYLKGEIHDNIGIIWRGKWTRTVGIKRSATTERPSGRGSYNIAQVARILEFGGGDVPARPLFGPATQVWINKHFPDWGRFFGNVMSKTYPDFFKEVQNNLGADIVPSLKKQAQSELSRAIDMAFLEAKDKNNIKGTF